MWRVQAGGDTAGAFVSVMGVAFNFKWRRISELFGFWLIFDEAGRGVNLCK
jgi:hypothetical protein